MKQKTIIPKTSLRQLTTTLLCLDSSFVVLKTVVRAEYLEAFIEKKAHDLICPHCSSDNCIGHDKALKIDS